MFSQLTLQEKLNARIKKLGLGQSETTSVTSDTASHRLIQDSPDSLSQNRSDTSSEMKINRDLFMDDNGDGYFELDDETDWDDDCYDIYLETIKQTVDVAAKNQITQQFIDYMNELAAQYSNCAEYEFHFTALAKKAAAAANLAEEIEQDEIEASEPADTEDKPCSNDFYFFYTKPIIAAEPPIEIPHATLTDNNPQDAPVAVTLVEEHPITTKSEMSVENITIQAPEPIPVTSRSRAMAHFNLGIADAQKNDYASALKQLTQGMILDEAGDAIFIQDRALALDWLKFYEMQAKKILNPDNLDSVALTLKLNSTKSKAQQLICISQLINLVNRDSSLYAMRAKLLAKEKIDEAVFNDLGIAIWMCRTQIDPDYKAQLPELLALRAKMHHRIDNIEENRKDFKAAIACCPADSKQKTKLQGMFGAQLREEAENLHQLKDFDKAIEIYTMAFQMLEGDKAKREKILNKIRQVKLDQKVLNEEAIGKEKIAIELIDTKKVSAKEARKNRKKEKIEAAKKADEEKRYREERDRINQEKKANAKKEKKNQRKITSQARKATATLLQAIASPEVKIQELVPESKTIVTPKSVTTTVISEVKEENVNTTRYELLKDAKDVIDQLNKHGFLTLATGGLVLNALEKKNELTDDIDIVTEASVEQIRQCFPNGHIVPDFFNPNLSHYVVGKISVGIYSSAHLANKELNTQDRIKADAYSRDLTFSAMYLTGDGELLDPTERGLRDFRAGRIAAIMPASKSLPYDPVRILRAIDAKTKLSERFDREFSFSNSIQTQLRKKSNALKTDSQIDSKIVYWLLKLFSRVTAEDNLSLLNEFGMTDVLMPTLDKKLLEQEKILAVIKHLYIENRGKVNTWLFKLLSGSHKFQVTTETAQQYLKILQQGSPDALYYPLLTLVLQKDGQKNFDQLAVSGVREQIFSRLGIKSANSITDVVQCISKLNPKTLCSFFVNFLSRADAEQNLNVIIQHGVVDKLFPGIKTIFTADNFLQNIVVYISALEKKYPNLVMLPWLTNYISQQMQYQHSILSENVKSLISTVTRQDMLTWILTVYLEEGAEKNIAALMRLGVVDKVDNRLGSILLNQSNELSLTPTLDYLFKIITPAKIIEWINKLLSRPNASDQINKFISAGILKKLFPEFHEEIDRRKAELIEKIQKKQWRTLNDILVGISSGKERNIACATNDIIRFCLSNPPLFTPNISQTRLSFVNNSKLAEENKSQKASLVNSPVTNSH